MRFLTQLDTDMGRAAESYERIRRTLIKFFAWQGLGAAEDWADVVLNRVIRKVDEGETLRDIPTYCHGIARMVLLEARKHPENRAEELESVTPAKLVVREQPTTDERDAWLQHCLKELPAESRHLILQYYTDQRRAKIDNRVALADQLGIPLSALRNRAQRIRARLEKCIYQHLKKTPSPDIKMQK